MFNNTFAFYYCVIYFFLSELVYLALPTPSIILRFERRTSSLGLFEEYIWSIYNESNYVEVGLYLFLKIGFIYMVSSSVDPCTLMALHLTALRDVENDYRYIMSLKENDISDLELVDGRVKYSTVLSY